MINMPKIYVLSFHENIVNPTNSKRWCVTIDGGALRVELGFMSCKQCLAGYSQVLEHNDLAFRTRVGFTTA